MTRKIIAKTTIFALIAGLLLCVLPGIATADEFTEPVPPHGFYGDLLKNDAPAPAGMKVEAKGEGVIPGAYNPIYTTVVGQYGNPGPMGDKLIVEGDATLVPGTILTFFVDDVSTEQTFAWQSGEITELDLSVTISEPAGGGGGGGGGCISDANCAPGYVCQNGVCVRAPEVETNVVGTEETFPISGTGQILETLSVTSPDGNITVTFPAGTIALDEFGNPLTSFTVTVDPDPPCPVPEDERIIGLAYDFQPDGATFVPPLEVVFKYSETDIAEKEVLEEDLILALCDEDTGLWVPVTAVINTEDNTMTAQIGHFTTFALLGEVIEVEPVPEPPKPPVPEPTLPAAFSSQTMSIIPAEVNPGEMVTISVTITNTGGEAGTHEVILKVNGVKEDSKTVSLAAGESKDVSFKTSRDKAGTYQIECDGLPGSFVVKEVVAPPVEPTIPEEPVPEPEEFNWPLWGGVIAAVIVIGLIVYFAYYRRRASA